MWAIPAVPVASRSGPAGTRRRGRAAGSPEGDFPDEPAAARRPLDRHPHLCFSLLLFRDCPARGILAVPGTVPYGSVPVIRR